MLLSPIGLPKIKGESCYGKSQEIGRRSEDAPAGVARERQLHQSHLKGGDVGAFANVNSLVREGKGDGMPHELAERALGKAFLDALALKKVGRRKANLKPLI